MLICYIVHSKTFTRIVLEVKDSVIPFTLSFRMPIHANFRNKTMAPDLQSYPSGMERSQLFLYHIVDNLLI